MGEQNSCCNTIYSFVICQNCQVPNLSAAKNLQIAVPLNASQFKPTRCQYQERIFQLSYSLRSDDFPLNLSYQHYVTCVIRNSQNERIMGGGGDSQSLRTFTFRNYTRDFHGNCNIQTSVEESTHLYHNTEASVENLIQHIDHLGQNLLWSSLVAPHTHTGTVITIMSPQLPSTSSPIYSSTNIRQSPNPRRRLLKNRRKRIPSAILGLSVWNSLHVKIRML